MRISLDKEMNSRKFYDIDVSAVLYIASATHPTQGVWISMVYFRPQYLKFRLRDPDDFRIASVLRVLNLSVPQFLTHEWWQSRRLDKGKENKETNDTSRNESRFSSSTDRNNEEVKTGNNVNSLVASGTDETQC